MPSATNDSYRFKLADAASYDAVTEEFDAFTTQLTTPLAGRMVTHARLQPGEKVLDVGAGTGIVSFQASDRVTPGGRVTGIDLSEGMLRFANAKNRRKNADGLDFARMDAENLSFADKSFDAVVSLFALLHFPNPTAALSEMFRVLRPGGRMVIAVGSRPPRVSLETMRQGVTYSYQAAQRLRGRMLIAPGFLNALTAKYFPTQGQTEESSMAHHGPFRSEGVLSLIRNARFAVVKTCWHGHSAAFRSAEDFWSVQRTFSTIARKRLASAPEQEVERLHSEFLAACGEVQARGGRLIYPFGAFYVIAQRPRQA